VVNLNQEALVDSDIIKADEELSLSEIQPDVELYCLENDEGDFHLLGLKNVIYSGETEFQRVLIADSCNYGRVLVLDGELQSAEVDEELYHEVLVQPAMILHPNPRRILIVGGGEGASLREVLRHKSVETVTMVDLDPKIIELCKEHLSAWHRGSFNDPRLNLVIAEGRQFITQDTSKYDVVIIDVVDLEEDGPARAIYTREFYQLLKSRLAPGGVIAVQAMEFSHLDHKMHGLLWRTLKAVFSEVHSYHAVVPSFLCDWAFILVSDWFNPRKMSPKAFDDACAMRVGTGILKHVDGEFFLSCFQFSKTARERMAEAGPIMEDSSTA
jgi:spermidine synthase